MMFVGPSKERKVKQFIFLFSLILVKEICNLQICNLQGAAAASAAANAANGQCGCEKEDDEVRATGMDDASAPARGGGCRFTPSMYGGPRGVADAGLFLRLPLAAFAALLTEGRERKVGGGLGPEPLAIARGGRAASAARPGRSTGRGGLGRGGRARRRRGASGGPPLTAGSAVRAGGGGRAAAAGRARVPGGS